MVAHKWPSMTPTTLTTPTTVVHDWPHVTPMTLMTLTTVVTVLLQYITDMHELMKPLGWEAKRLYRHITKSSCLRFNHPDVDHNIVINNIKGQWEVQQNQNFVLPRVSWHHYVTRDFKQCSFLWNAFCGSQPEPCQKLNLFLKQEVSCSAMSLSENVQHEWKFRSWPVVFRPWWIQTGLFGCWLHNSIF